MFKNISDSKETTATPTDFFSTSISILLNKTNVSVWEYCHTTDKFLFNPQYELFTGYSAFELSNTLEARNRVIHPEDKEHLSQKINACYTGEIESFESEYRIVRKDGNIIWVQETVAVTGRDVNNIPTKLTGVQHNITHIKIAEENQKFRETLLEIETYNKRLKTKVENAVHALEDSRQMSSAMFDANPYINLIFNDKLQVIDCNPIALEYFGFKSKDEFLKDFLCLIDNSIPSHQPSGKKSIRLQDRFEHTITHGYNAFETELIVQGNLTPLNVVLKKIKYKDSFAIVGYIIDLHTIKEAKSELLRQDKLLKTVNIVSNLLIANEDKDLTDTLIKALNILGQCINADRAFIWRNRECNGKLCASEFCEWSKESSSRYGTLSPVDLPYDNFMPNWRTTLRLNQCINGPIRSLEKETAAFIRLEDVKSVLVIPIFLQGNFWGFIGFDDCKEERTFKEMEANILRSSGMLIASSIMRYEINENLVQAKEAALSSSRAKTDFLSRMSHEIRTPMNAIIGMTTIANKKSDVDEIKYCLNKIDSSSHQLLGIINDVLDMSKIEADKFEICMQEFDFEHMLQNVINIIQIKAEEKHQEFSINLLHSFSNKVISDELRLTQVLINLLNNAVKFTPDHGAITLKVKDVSSDLSVSRLRFEIIDTGIGISADQQERLFHSFEQADGGITRKYGGTGLGLAICKKIITLMGGDLWVVSELGVGSSFIFEINITWGSKCTHTLATEFNNEEPEQPNWSNKHLLLAEDIEINAEILLAILEDTCVTVDLAHNGMEAIDMFVKEENRYDLILMDIQMPVLDGLNATRKIRSLNTKRAAEIPIIAMTANAFKKDVRNCLDAGMNAHIAKPIETDSLMNTLALYLDS